MKKIKSPYYAAAWVLIWTAALIWFLLSGMFDRRESLGLIVVWIVLVSATFYSLWTYYRAQGKNSKTGAFKNPFILI